MVIRHIRQHIETHNWFAVTIDLAIVVVGVFLGAQANNWNERRIEHDQGVSYRGRLIEELDFNARLLGQQLSYYEQVRGHALATLAALESPRGVQSPEFLIHAYQSTQIDITTTKRSIYDEMVSTGLVDRLGSGKLQAEVSDYYLSMEATKNTFNDVPPYRALMRTLMPHTAQAQIRDRCGDLEVTQGGRIVGYRLPENCVVSLDPTAVAAGMARIRSEPRLHDELNRYLSWINEKVGSLKDDRTLSNELRQVLLKSRE